MEILNDFSTSVRKALEEIDPNYESYDGLIIAGTHTPHDVEEMIEKIKKARETGRPFYGECFGHQLAAVEFARNVLNIRDATSEEWGQGTYVVRKLPQLNVGLKNGESYWNNYVVTEQFLRGWDKPKHFITVQYHASYQSSKDKPHPVLVEFLNLCRGRV